MMMKQWIISFWVGVTCCLLGACQSSPPPSPVIELTFPAPKESLTQSISSTALQPLSEHLLSLDHNPTEPTMPFKSWLQALLTTCQGTGGPIAFDILAHTQRLTDLTDWALWCHQAEKPWATQALAYTQWMSPETLLTDQEHRTFISLRTWIHERTQAKDPRPLLSTPDYTRWIKQLSYVTEPVSQTLSTFFEALVALPLAESPEPQILKQYVVLLEKQHVIPAIHPWRYYEILATP